MRLARKDDEPFLWRMLAAAAGNGYDTVPVDDVGADPVTSRYLDGWGRPGDVGVVALDGDEPVGAAWCRFFRVDAPAYGFVDEATPELAIGCLPNHRGQGIGRLLLEALFEAAHGAGFERLSLSVSTANERAVRLYRRLGFQPVGPWPDEGSVTMVARVP
jgi:GNAT superfamily N-acetyltransferase